MVKKLFKSVHIYRSYRQNKPGGPLFWATQYFIPVENAPSVSVCSAVMTVTSYLSDLQILWK